MWLIIPSKERIKARPRYCGARKSRIFACTVSATARRTSQGQQLTDNGQDAEQDIAGSKGQGHPPGHHQIGDQHGIQGQLEHGRPFHQGKMAAAVFKDHRLMDHRQFQMGGRIVDGDAPRFGYRHEDKAHRGEDE